MFLFRICWYSTAATDTAAYIIGGSAGDPWHLSTIAEFKNNKWRKFGDLTTWRRKHSSISFGGETIILGGSVRRGK